LAADALVQEFQVIHDGTRQRRSALLSVKPSGLLRRTVNKSLRRAAAGSAPPYDDVSPPAGCDFHQFSSFARDEREAAFFLNDSAAGRFFAVGGVNESGARLRRDEDRVGGARRVATEMVGKARIDQIRTGMRADGNSSALTNCSLLTGHCQVLVIFW
jgi:hypothetical protein